MLPASSQKGSLTLAFPKSSLHHSPLSAPGWQQNFVATAGFNTAREVLFAENHWAKKNFFSLFDIM
jgi:hypothetical protein